MDPVTAWAAAVKAVAEMVTEIVKGMTPEAKQKVWDWYIADQERMRRWFKLDEKLGPSSGS